MRAWRTLWLTSVALLVAGAVVPAGAEASSTPRAAEEPSVCQVVVPARVVLRAQHYQDLFSVGAAWGPCPQWVRDYGYNSDLPDYPGRPLTWEFTRVSGPAVAARYRNCFLRSLPLTALDGHPPRVGGAGTGGDYAALLPGTYAFDHALTFGESVENNLNGVDLTASGRFVAKYWSKVAVAATRSGRLTTLTVSGRRDGPILTPQQYYVLAAPGKNIPASSGRVQLRRDGRLLATVTLDRYGRARTVFHDTRGRHTYTATLIATAWNWAAHAAVRR